MNILKFLLILVLLISTAFAKVKKVVIFYAPVGMGHESAAKSIKAGIEKRNPNIVVELVDNRQFLPEFMQKLTDKVYWSLFENYQGGFNFMFDTMMVTGNLVNNPENIPMREKYNMKAFEEFLNKAKPDVILSTHFGASEVMGDFRQRGKFKDIPVGWMHTDYFEGYFTRTSERIDQTFLGHEALEELWRKRGLDDSLFTTTGMPVNSKDMNSDRTEIFKKYNLDTDPNIKTFVLANGGQGAGDMVGIVESFKKAYTGKKQKVQIIAVTAKNTVGNYEKLTEYKKVVGLPENMNLELTKFIPNADLLGLINNSDLYMTKAGGLSPTEAFALVKPLVLFGNTPGQERENAILFEKLGLAVINKDVETIGEDSMNLINDQKRLARMHKAQTSFKNNISMDKIVDFVFDNKKKLNNKFNLTLTKRYIPNFNKQYPLKTGNLATSNVELFLKKNGQMAIRVGLDKVYEMNGNGVTAKATKSYLIDSKDKRIALRLYGVTKDEVKSIEKSITSSTSLNEILEKTLVSLGAGEIAKDIKSKKSTFSIFHHLVNTLASDKLYTTEYIKYSYNRNSELVARARPVKLYKLEHTIKKSVGICKNILNSVVSTLSQSIN